MVQGVLAINANVVVWFYCPTQNTFNVVLGAILLFLDYSCKNFKLLLRASMHYGSGSGNRHFVHKSKKYYILI